MRQACRPPVPRPWVLVLGLVVGFGGCGPRPETIEAWLDGHVPRGASLLAEGKALEWLGARSDARVVGSVADEPEAQVLGYDFVLLDSRVYGPNLSHRKHRAPVYRRLARDPRLEPLDLFETRSVRGPVKLLLLRRRRADYLEVRSLTLSAQARDAGSVAPFEVDRPVGLYLLRLRAAGAQPPLVDGKERPWRSVSAILLETEPFVLERGSHEFVFGPGPAPELVEVLALGSLRNNQLIEEKVKLLSLFDEGPGP